ncbi:rCG45563 [Rattus norvegicus]|uniref:RCG45563 n=1 Tax=Rattus norvegicus TaxID=10116 RepID=A6JTL9_RAT|nr:rCG45563 [Rattus norvegicus]
MGMAMTSHWLPALARYPGMPGEGTWVSLGAVTKSPSIPGDAAVWKTEGVGPNSPSDCGIGGDNGPAAATGPAGHLRFSATGAPTEPPSRVVTQMRDMAQELQGEVT